MWITDLSPRLWSSSSSHNTIPWLFFWEINGIWTLPQGIPVRSKLQLVGQAPGSASTQVHFRIGFSAGLSGSLMPSFLAFFCTWDRALYSKSQTWRWWCSEPFLCSTPFGWKNPPLILEKEYQAQSLPGVLAANSRSMVNKQNSSVIFLYNKTREARRTLDFCLRALDAAGWWCWETMVIHSDYVSFCLGNLHIGPQLLLDCILFFWSMTFEFFYCSFYISLPVEENSEDPKEHGARR